MIYNPPEADFKAASGGLRFGRIHWEFARRACGQAVAGSAG